MKILLKGTDREEYLGPVALLWVINSTDWRIDVSVEECIVNGEEADTYYSSCVSAEKQAVNRLSFGEENQPETIESLTVCFSIYDWDSGTPIVEKTEPASVNSIP